jgi:hypothetical protein
MMTSKDTTKRIQQGTLRANFDDLIHYTANMGAYTGSDSPYGAFDQAGNIFEAGFNPPSYTRESYDVVLGER